MLTHDRGRAARLAAEKDRSNDDRVGELYQRAFSRPPNPAELEAARQHLAKAAGRSSDEKGNPVDGLRQGYEDLVWALLNTKEFLFNH
jgi:hypothetical protein